MLSVKDLVVNYGAIQAIKKVSFEIHTGEIVTLIGANGAGKSTILHTISGIMRPVSGQVTYLDRQIQKVAAPRIVQAGISQVPEGRHIFPGLSVQENLQMGAFLRKDRRSIAQAYEDVYNYFPVLKQRRHQDAATLSGGEQQMLAMGRALMAAPKLMLLDEPSMGLAPIFINEIFDIIRAINAAGTTVLLIEQNANKALSIADRGYVLASGEIKLSGTGQELLANTAVQQAYLGG
ncbi:ABC transporter ATP-binding protein [Levilactobacillus parabrevis]|uniref:Branched-chain amino acid ABC transporter, ATP-binding protein n=1 Tax=Levilactobacillus parabrevis ATCC 53295 TaxID=1267003 RepID=A0A0R1GR23_9LACO|nr:ABC transporter ATP-binding protein [Levilactobacillus parabrevis]KRK36523.1 branched-chain amino acid ABC transporter, ATP-binding protein [Levilactobacillus parabrevis ATCC 53295]KRO05883.1 branched-chain amino acid ABC transporter, ATP-binding protein [Levilactobacillus parabrevis]